MGLSASKTPPMTSTPAAPLPTRQARLGGVRVTISEPPGDPSGITFLIPGAMLSESSYLSTRRVLHEEQNQIVISFYVNVFTKSHDAYAKDVGRIFDAYCQQYHQPPHSSSNHAFDGYNIVGHSVGGKIALLCATPPPAAVAKKNCRVDKDERPSSPKNAAVYTVLALDPVDDRPPEFTNADESRNRRAFPGHCCAILTHATATPAWAIPTAHNAQAIIRHVTCDDDKIRFRIHKDAAHMAYTDDGGGVLGWMMKGGTKAGNFAARQDAHALIRQYVSSKK